VSLKNCQDAWVSRACIGLANTLGWRAWGRSLVLKALAKNPDDTFALATLAHWQAMDQAWDAARETLVRCAAVGPEKASTWFNLGFVCERLQRPLEAEHAFRRATECAPALDRAWYGLGLALIAQDRLVEAAEAFQVNTRLQPMGPCGWYQLARVQNDLGAVDDAAATIARLRQFEPKVARQLERETGLGV
jgi:Flp pilus assembly protein TadD